MNSYLPKLLIVFLLVFACSVSAKIKVTIDSPDPVRGSKVKLGDIATITGDDKSLVNALSSLELDRAPLPGRKRMMKSVYIAMKIKGLLPEMYPLEVDAPKFVEIRSQGQTITGEEMAKKVSDYVYYVRGWKKSEASVRALKIPRDEYLPPGKTRYEYNILSRQAWGRILCRIDMYQNDERIRSVPVTLEVKKFGEVCVATEDMRIGDVIREGSIVLEKRELRIQDMQEEVLTSLDELEGQEVRRYIKQGNVITRRCLNRPDAVNRNDDVSIIASFGNVKITAKGVARESGAVGEMIQVEYPNTRHLIMGKVIARNIVALEQ